MIVTAVDANVLLDLLTGDAALLNESASALRVAKSEGRLLISIIVYAEIASNFASRHLADDFFLLLNGPVELIDQPIAFQAASFYREYKERGGSRARILPDFLIAAHAQLRAHRILTRDKRFFKDSFPRLQAISPAELLSAHS